MAQNITTETVITQQFITLTTGLTTATAMNLPQTLIEPFNLFASTRFFTGMNGFTNAFNDYLTSLKGASTGFIPGYINPAHLRFSLHAQGTGNGFYNANDNPIYNSNNGATGKMTLTGQTVLTPPNLLSGGTPAATTSDPNFPIANAFDANLSTMWASYNSGIIPSAEGAILAATNFSTGAIATVTGNLVSGVAITQLHVGNIQNVVDGNAGTTFEWVSGLRLQSTQVGGSGTVYTIKINFGVVRALKGINVSGPGGTDGGTWSSSNDDITYTPFTTHDLSSGSLSNVPASAQYIRYQTGVGSGGYTASIFYQFDTTSVANQMKFQYDLGAGNSIVANNYSFTATNSAVRPITWTLQGSNDAVIYDVLDTQTNYAGSYPFSGSFINGNAYRYYALIVTESNSTFANDALIGDIKVWNNGVATPNITVGTPQIVTYDIGAAVTGTQYTVNAVANAQGITNFPTSWVLEASTNNSTWVPMETVTAYAGAFPRVATFANTTPYRYWRLRITASQNYSDVVTIANFQVTTAAVTTFYDTTTVTPVFGTSSLRLRYNVLTGAGQNVNELQLGNFDWRWSSYANFDAGFLTNQCLFSLPNQLEIIKTPSGVDVKYSVNGSTFTTVSASFAWATNTWYWIAVGRSGNTLHININGTDIGTASMTGINLFATASNTFKVGADTNNLNPFIGNMQEQELFVCECPAFTVPVSARNTAYIPAINWVSASTYVPPDTVELDCILFLDTAQFAAFGIPTFGTDAHLYISMDNGVNYTEMPLTRDGSLTVSSRIYRGFLELDGIPSTTDLLYKIVSDSGKVFKFDGIIFYWQDEASLALNAEMIWNFPDRTVTGGGGGITAADVWNYVNRELTTNDAVKLTDIIPAESDIPSGDITVKQVLELISKRLKHDKNTPQL